MRKHLWAIIVPRLLSSSSGDANWEVVEPGHWWKMTVSQDQAEIWRELWGKDISMSQLIDVVWTGVLHEIPAVAASWVCHRKDRGNGVSLEYDDK